LPIPARADLAVGTTQVVSGLSSRLRLPRVAARQRQPAITRLTRQIDYIVTFAPTRTAVQGFVSGDCLKRRVLLGDRPETPLDIAGRFTIQKQK
jgi:hypothetical protein